MMQRAHNWEYLFNPATGYIGARSDDGSFPPGPAFQASQLEPGGQLGFEEGNAVQYTWSVPQDLAALSTLMGGDAATVAKLNTFFTSLNATRNLPYDWAGNEPSLVDALGVRLLRRTVADPAGGARHRRHALRRRPGRRAGQRRPRGHCVLVRVGGHRDVPGHPRNGRTWPWPARCSPRW